ncbi:MAG TPA: serine hydrolase [Chloroflexota bacterium]|nr:serine hydrolase [Chloroflexota bacterium]
MTTEATTAPQPLQAAHDVVTHAMERLHVPGVGLGLLHEGHEYVSGFGVGNVEAPLPVTGDTLFQIGSITKTFTATTIMRLVDRGELDLDVPIRTYLPDFEFAGDAAATITTRHLLQHSSGIEGDLFQDTGRGDDALAGYVSRMRTFPPVAPVGALFSYSNGGFTLAGRLIEVVTGQVYETAVRELLLDPLGLTDSSFFAEQVMLRRFAVGHGVINERAEVMRGSHPDIPTGEREWWAILRSCAPEGGLACSPRDLLHYARFHLGNGAAPDGTRLLEPESLQAMHAPAVPAGPDGWVGLSWFIRDVQGIRIVSHDGGTNGQIARLLFVPERDFALAILTNADRGGRLAREVEQTALATFLGIKEPEPRVQERSATELAAYVGRYENEAPTGGVIVSVRDGLLALEHIPRPSLPGAGADLEPQTSRAAFCGDDQIVILDGPGKDTCAEFLRDSQGTVRWFRWGRAFRRRS